MSRLPAWQLARQLLLAGGAAFVVVTCIGGRAGAATTVPYTDPNAVGSIGLCNQAGQQVTSGSTTAAPFAWRAVSTTPAQAPYNNSYRTAVLLAYQPVNGLLPAEWSGTELTASARYSNPDAPMAAATSDDDSLADFMDNYHPRWDGFLQLRMYLGTADEQQYALHYPSLDIQVKGNTWTAVGGATVNCNSGTAESIESVVLPSTTTTKPATSTGSGNHSSTSGTGGTASGTHGTSSNPTGGASSAGGGSGGATPAVATSGGASHGWIIGLVIAVVLAAIAALLYFRRRRGTGDAAGAGPGADGAGPTEADPASPELRDLEPDPAEPLHDLQDQTVTSSSTSMKGQHP